MPNSWKKNRSTEHGSFRIFRVREDHYTHPKLESERSFFVLETFDWVNVVAVTTDQCYVLVRQFRPGSEQVSLEVPGGVVEPNEDPALAAARELQEETGYTGEAPILLSDVDPNPAIQNNRHRIYLIRNAARSHEPTPDPDEVLEIELHPTEASEDLLQRHEVRHSLTHLAVRTYCAWNARTLSG